MEALGWTLAALLLIFELLALYTDRRHSDVLASFGGVCYPPLLGGAFLLLRNYDAGGDEGRWLAIGLWGALWICDTAAYAGGAAFGRHPLAPQISPKKTVEGLIAGVVGTAAFMTLWRLLGLIPTELAVAMVVAVGLIGQLGDLVESSIKREAGVKDSGTMLPGHGGALDRFDSLFAAAPALAMYLIIESYLRI